MKKILALTIVVALLVITGMSFADVPPIESMATMAENIIQALKAQYGPGLDALIVMDGDYCVIYVWKSISKVNLKVQLPERGISMRMPPIEPQPMPDFKIIIGTVNVLR